MMRLPDLINGRDSTSSPADAGPPVERQTIAGLLDRALRSAGEHPALVEGKASCTYLELDRWANGIARTATARAALAGQRACILTGSGPASTAAFLGLCKIGMMSVRLDAEQPLPYLRAIMDDAEPTWLFATAEHRRLAESLAGGTVQVIDLERECPGQAAAPDRQPSPDDPIGITYTSGSTGRPKGVVHTHRSTLALVRSYLSCTALGRDDRVALLHDSRSLDMLAALSTGATAYRFPLMQHGFEGLADWLARNRITILPTVPSVLRHIVRAIPDRRGLHLRLLRLSGEVLTADDVRRAAEVLPRSCRLLNWFGSTEVAVASCCLSLREMCEMSTIPAGDVFPGIEVELADAEIASSGGKETGEIVVSGDALFAGYWRRPDLDEQRISIDPRVPGRRRFRTGDMGYFDSAGHLVVAGRADDQIKVNGYRVEPNEIEAVLRSLPGVDDAVVRIITEERDGIGSRKVLAAYVVSGSDTPPALSAIRRQLAERLPRYMTPSYFARIDDVPRLAGGKPDRTALPELVATTRRDYNPVVAVDAGHDPRLDDETARNQS